MSTSTLSIVLMTAVLLNVPSASAKEPVSDLRVMSFNIRYGSASDGASNWDHRKEFLVETVKALAPDLLGTQETLAFQRDFLMQQLPDYDVWAAGREDGKQRGEMMAIFYRRERFDVVDRGHFWLSTTPDVVGSKSWDSSLPRMASWIQLRDRRLPSALPVLFCNTHFDHRGATARLESARLIRAKLTAKANQCSVILTGDFNAAVDSPPYQAIFAPLNQAPSILVDSYRKIHPQSSDRDGTFSGFKAGASSGARIDWIGLSRDWKIVDATIDRTSRDGRTPSDHFPVTATIHRDLNR